MKWLFLVIVLYNYKFTISEWGHAVSKLKLALSLMAGQPCSEQIHDLGKTEPY